MFGTHTDGLDGEAARAFVGATIVLELLTELRVIRKALTKPAE